MVSFTSANSIRLPMADQVDRINVEELVREVERHPPLWDASCEGYAIKQERDKGWDEVIARFLPDYQERSNAERAEIGSLFRRRWKSMRTCYARELNRQKKTPGKFRRKYLYYDLLRFLDPVMSSIETAKEKSEPKAKRPRRNRRNSVEPETAPEATAAAPKEETKRKKEEPVTKSRPRTITVPKRRNPISDEADRMFLMSLVPDFQNVPGRNKMRLKMEILEAISRAQESAEEDYRTPSTSREAFDCAETNFAEDAGESLMDFAEVKLEAAEYSSTDDSPESSFAGD